MFSEFLVEFIPQRFRVPIFALGVLVGLSAIVVFGVRLVSFNDANHSFAFTLKLAVAMLGSATYACILAGLVLRKRLYFWIADSLIAIAIIGPQLATVLVRLR